MIKTEQTGEKLFAKLQALRRALAGKENSQSAVRSLRSLINRNSAVIGHRSSVI